MHRLAVPSFTNVFFRGFKYKPKLREILNIDNAPKRRKEVKTDPTCKGCGAPMRRIFRDFPSPEDSNWHSRKESTKKKQEKISYRAKNNKKHDKLFDNLDLEKKSFLANEALRTGFPGPPGTEVSFSTSNAEQLEKSLAEKKAAEKEERRTKVCLRCKDISLQLVPAIRQPTRNLYFSDITHQDTLVVVLDAMDFPASIPVFSNLTWQRQNILWVINRIDLIVSEPISAAERALPYFRKYLGKFHGVDPQNVFAVSSMLGWGVRSFAARLGKVNYFVGSTNGGKSRLVNRLVEDFGYPETQLTPLDGYAISNMPWTTQGERAFQLPLDRKIVDMPSYPELDDGLWGALKRKSFRGYAKGRLLSKPLGRYNIRRLVASPSQAISIAGLLVIVQDDPNSTVRLIAWPIMNNAISQVRLARSVEKIKEIASLADVPEQQKKWFGVRPSVAVTLKEREKYIFKGEGLSIAIRGIGVVHLHASGKIPDEGVRIAVHAVHGVNFQTRPNIMEYLKDMSVEKREKISQQFDWRRNEGL